jgi:hypothetical protein
VFDLIQFTPSGVESIDDCPVRIGIFREFATLAVS